ncbi:hypothetical protein Pla52o_25260 [Novipirellula galeiformis]|uniref:Uncharacterized protein n=1 Tax=Novipirellula galeiformis TaxID=2528004 RepID=A0A5C6CFR1_9BACT|nr:hypothetical protein Pla52o_25260 [Novipirellula galeiformis]
MGASQQLTLTVNSDSRLTQLLDAPPRASTIRCHRLGIDPDDNGLEVHGPDAHGPDDSTAGGRMLQSAQDQKKLGLKFAPRKKLSCLRHFEIAQFQSGCVGLGIVT